MPKNSLMPVLKDWLRKRIKDWSAILLLIGIGVIIIFSQPLVLAFSNYWVKPIMGKITPSYWIDAMLLLYVICLIGYYFFIKNFRHYQANWKLVIISIAFAGIYSNIRFGVHPVWIFLDTKTFPALKYLDIFFIMAFISLGLIVKFFWSLFLENKSSENNYFFNDLPLKKEAFGKIVNSKEKQIPDKYGFLPYAENIAEGIKNSKFENAFAIGITAKWGSGKTSFINMIQAKLEKDIVLIEFNPWKSSSSNAIIKDFFETLRGHLDDYGFRLNRQIIKYAQKIIELNNNSVGKSVGGLISLLASNSSLQQMFDDINGTMKRLNKKMVIIIDDVDRLMESEVLEVIRLVRNTANFYNTFFIVAYDKPYVLQCLKRSGIPDYEIYLEKVFQLEITFPYFEKQALTDQLMDNLKTFIKEERIENLKAIIDKDVYLKYKLFEWLKSFRDVTLLCNSMRINMRNKLADVDLIDFIFIELLRVKYPAVYIAFFENYKEAFRDGNGLFNENQDEFRLGVPEVGNSVESDTKEGKIIKLERQSYFFNYLMKNKDNLILSESSIEKVCGLLGYLFGLGEALNINGNISETLSARSFEIYKLSIIHVFQFPLYYSFEIPKWEIPNSVFLATIQQPLDKIKETYKQWLDKKMGQELLRNVKGLKIEEEIKDKQVFMNFILSLFFFENCVRASHDYYQIFDTYNMIGIIYNGREKYFSEDLKSYATFIASLFSTKDSNEQSPQKSQANFLKEYLNKDTLYSPPPIINRQQAIDFLVGYLKDVCSTENKFNTKVFYFYDCTNIPSAVPENEAHRDAHIPQAHELFEKFLSEKDLDDFLVGYCLIKRNVDPGKTAYQLHYNINKLFGSLDKFEKFLEKQDAVKWQTLIEFKKFFTQAKLVGSQFIEFPFEKIDTGKIKDEQV